MEKKGLLCSLSVCGIEVPMPESEKPLDARTLSVEVGRADCVEGLLAEPESDSGYLYWWPASADSCMLG